MGRLSTRARRGSGTPSLPELASNRRQNVRALCPARLRLPCFDNRRLSTVPPSRNRRKSDRESRPTSSIGADLQRRPRRRDIQLNMMPKSGVGAMFRTHRLPTGERERLLTC